MLLSLPPRHCTQADKAKIISATLLDGSVSSDDRAGHCSEKHGVERWEGDCKRSNDESLRRALKASVHDLSGP